MGDTVCINYDVQPHVGDVDSLNNTFNYCSPVSGPFDPNFKYVMPEGIGTNGLVPPETEFTYTIGFQNTGTDTAINVFIFDTLSTGVDINSIEIIGATHPMNFYIIDGHIIKFVFNLIFLPDSNVNEPASHGFVQYKIRAKAGLVDGTVINNNAFIYFDNNLPIETNSTINTISTPLSVIENLNLNFKVYPVPSDGSLNLEFGMIVSGTINLFDVTGNRILEQKVNNSAAIIDTKAIANGCYLLQVNIQQYNFQRTVIILR